MLPWSYLMLPSGKLRGPQFNAIVMTNDNMNCKKEGIYIYIFKHFEMIYTITFTNLSF